MEHAYICDALRTPFGRYGGWLAVRPRTGGRYALCTMCIGVGQGVATIVERV